MRPKARGLDTRQELLKFYEENYSANLMHLVVYAKGNESFVLVRFWNTWLWVVVSFLLMISADSLDKVQTLVQNNFDEIQNINRSSPRFTGQPCSSEHLQVISYCTVLIIYMYIFLWPKNSRISRFMKHFMFCFYLEVKSVGLLCMHQCNCKNFFPFHVLWCVITKFCFSFYLIHLDAEWFFLLDITFSISSSFMFLVLDWIMKMMLYLFC